MTTPPNPSGPAEPDSARRALTPAQARLAAVTAGLLVLAFAAAPHPTAIALTAVLIALYVIVVADRVALIRRGSRSPGLISIGDEEARALPDSELPVYTVLVPAYQEPEVIGDLVAALRAMDYPPDRLDVKLLLEEDDFATLEAAFAAGLDESMQVLLVPDGEPRTKPRACNVGLATARGRYVTIYDAEDRPEPLQLRRAVAAFAKVEPDVVCLQSILAFYNAAQNLLTRWFAAEYLTWFVLLLPGLVARGAPVPLGGTSNHFRGQALAELGGWDPWNVTEDADLGVRLHRRGMRTLVLGSVTYEEANSDFVNWAKQRSRWYKGYLQTCLVHLRDPRSLVRQIGIRGTLCLLLFVGGTPLLAVANSVFWMLTACWVLGVEQINALFPPIVYHVGLSCAVGGNFVLVYLHLICTHRRAAPRILFSTLLMPAYWLMMSIAAWKALVQLISAPSFWEKTTHGLTVTPPPARSPEPDPIADRIL